MSLVERFLRYTHIDTTAEPDSTELPTSPGQLELGRVLMSELEAIGLSAIEQNEQGIVTALLPATLDEPLPTIAFLAHLDTSPETTGTPRARIERNYQGGDIVLNNEDDVRLSPDEFPELSQYVGDDLIVTDGHNLLGSDDKAGIAEIIEAMARLAASDIPHGPVKIAFLPDSEIGLRGAQAFDVEAFGADFAYALDCGGVGELIFDNWNAADARLIFNGRHAHSTTAKGRLRNALIMAHELIARLPENERPENTEGRQGFYWVNHLSGNSTRTVMDVAIREFDGRRFQLRKQFLSRQVAELNSHYGADSVELSMHTCFTNTNEIMDDASFYAVEMAEQAMRNLGIDPKPLPMRGGYDGAVLTEKGLPTPNIFTGGRNFHSVYEYVPVSAMEKACANVIELVRLTVEWGRQGKI